MLAAVIRLVVMLSSILELSSRQTAGIPLHKRRQHCIIGASVDPAASMLQLPSQRLGLAPADSHAARVETSEGRSQAPTLQMTLEGSADKLKNDGRTNGTQDAQKRLLCYLKQKSVHMLPRSLPILSNSSNCAIVSSSGALLQHKFGKEIDKHPVVIRFNDAPIEDFEQYVGSKETVRMLSLKGFQRYKSHVNRSSVILWADQSNGPPAEFADSEPPGHMFRLNMSKLYGGVNETLQTLFASRWWTEGLDGVSFLPTTGAIGMIVAMALCDEVVAYDMTPSAASGTAPYHYYGYHSTPASTRILSADDNSFHKGFEAERELWARLSSTPRDVIYETGKMAIPGFSTYSCDEVVGEPDRIL